MLRCASASFVVIDFVFCFHRTCSYTSEGVRNAFDERFPTIMTQLRKVLPGIPATPEPEDVVETRTVRAQFAWTADIVALFFLRHTLFRTDAQPSKFRFTPLYR